MTTAETMIWRDMVVAPGYRDRRPPGEGKQREGRPPGGGALQRRFRSDRDADRSPSHHGGRSLWQRNRWRPVGSVWWPPTPVQQALTSRARDRPPAEVTVAARGRQGVDRLAKGAGSGSAIAGSPRLDARTARLNSQSWSRRPLTTLQIAAARVCNRLVGHRHDGPRTTHRRSKLEPGDLGTGDGVRPGSTSCPS